MSMSPAPGTQSISQLLDDTRRITVRRESGPAVHDSLVRACLRKLQKATGISEVTCDVATTSGAVHLVRVRFRGPARIEWADAGLDLVGPFVATRSASVELGDKQESALWTIVWSTPKSKGACDPTRRDRLWKSIEAWAATHRWTPDDVGPFIDYRDFFDGNRDEQSIAFPTWPRRLELNGICECLDALRTAQGVHGLYLEIGSPHARGPHAWPIAADLAIGGETDVERVARELEGLGLCGTRARVAESSSIDRLDVSNARVEVVNVSVGVWLSAQLAPFWQRCRSSASL